MGINEIAAKFLNARLFLEGRRFKMFKTEKEYRAAVFTDAETLANALLVLQENGFAVTGQGKNIVYGPFLRVLAESITPAAILELYNAGWTAIDTVCPKRAKLAFIIE